VHCVLQFVFVGIDNTAEEFITLDFITLEFITLDFITL
jgi:hypothetical protein